MQEPVARRLDREADLRRALDREDLVLAPAGDLRLLRLGALPLLPGASSGPHLEQPEAAPGQA